MAYWYFKKLGEYDVRKRYVPALKDKGTTVPKAKPYEDKGTHTK